MGNNAGRRAEFLLNQILSSSNEVLESVRLILALAGIVPAIPALLASAYMGDGINETAVNQGQDAGVETGRNGISVSAISIEKQRRCAVELGLFTIDQ